MNHKFLNKYCPEGTKRRRNIRIATRFFKSLVNPTFYKNQYSNFKEIGKKEGFNNLKKYLIYGEEQKMDTKQYREWIKENEPSKEELEKQRKIKFKVSPKISILVPIYNTPIVYFSELVDCLKEQTYSNWELCLADGSQMQNKELINLIKDDERIKYYFIGENKNIAGNTNECLKLATGEYIALFDHDDLLPPFCLYEIVKAINKNECPDFIYTDEDKIMPTIDKRSQPHFKPDFSIDTLRSCNYITHFSVFKKEIMDKLKGERSKYNGAQDYDIILRMSEISKNIVHIPKILYHWRVHPQSTAQASDAKPYAFEAGKKALEDHTKRIGLNAKVLRGQTAGVYEIVYDVIGNPKVTILLPYLGNVYELKKSVKSILNKTTYKNYELVIIDNERNEEQKDEENLKQKYYKNIRKNTKVKVLKCNSEKINESSLFNYGIENTNSDYILCISSDTKIITKDYLEKFIGYAQRKDVGAVGPRIYFENGSIYHAGMVVGINGEAENMLEGLPKNIHGYFSRDCLVQNVSALTNKCIFVKREKFESIGKFDEKFNNNLYSVDFCLKLKEKGLNNIYNPYIELYIQKQNLEDERKTLEKESDERKSKYFSKKWESFIQKGDPHYNPNLSLKTTDYSLNISEDK